MNTLQAEARERLVKATTELQASLYAGTTHTRVWESCAGGERTAVGKGWLTLYRCSTTPSVPGYSYSSNQGADSDNSFSGFLPGVTYEEAKLLVYGDYLKYTRRSP